MAHQLSWSKPVSADADAEYCQTVDIDLATLEPQVAKPHTFENVVPVSAVAGTRIDQAMVGSCANGNVDDIETVASVMKGNRVHPKTRFLVQPNSWGVYREAMRRGLFDTLLDAGVTVLSPGCHLCLGMQGALDRRRRLPDLDHAQPQGPHGKRQCRHLPRRSGDGGRLGHRRRDPRRPGDQPMNAKPRAGSAAAPGCSATTSTPTSSRPGELISFGLGDAAEEDVIRKNAFRAVRPGLYKEVQAWATC